MLPGVLFFRVTPATYYNIFALTLKAHQQIKFSNYNTGSVKQNHKTTALMSTFLNEINHILFKLFGGSSKPTE